MTTTQKRLLLLDHRLIRCFCLVGPAHNMLFGETAKDTVPNGRVSSASTDSPPGGTSSRYRSPFLHHDGQDPKRAKTDREGQVREWNAATPSLVVRTDGAV